MFTLEITAVSTLSYTTEGEPSATRITGRDVKGCDFAITIYHEASGKRAPRRKGAALSTKAENGR